MKSFWRIKKITFLVLLIFCSSQMIFAFDYGTFGITQSGSGYWQTLYFAGHWYPVVFTATTTYNNSEPYTIRMEGFNMTDVDFQIDEWDCQDGSHPYEQGNYVVFEKGTHNFSGLEMYATNIYGVDSNWQTISFDSYITLAAPPVVLAQCVSYGESDAVTVRIRNITTTSFDIKLQEDESKGPHIPEWVNVAILKQGTFGNYEVKTVTGVTDSWTFVNNSSVYNNAVILGTIQTYNGGDTVNLRIYKTGIDAYVKAEEEQCADAETAHTTENVGLLIYYY